MCHHLSVGGVLWSYYCRPNTYLNQHSNCLFKLIDVWNHFFNILDYIFSSSVLFPYPSFKRRWRQVKRIIHMMWLKWNKMRSQLEAKMNQNPARILAIGRHKMTGGRQLHCWISVDKFLLIVFIQHINSLLSTGFSAYRPSSAWIHHGTVAGSRHKPLFVPSSVTVLKKIDLIIML